MVSAETGPCGDECEVPVEAVLRAAEIAHTGDRRVILDPASAPSQPLAHELYGYLTVINPNEVEAKSVDRHRGDR